MTWQNLLDEAATTTEYTAEHDSTDARFKTRYELQGLVADDKYDERFERVDDGGWVTLFELRVWEEAVETLKRFQTWGPDRMFHGGFRQYSEFRIVQVDHEILEKRYVLHEE